VRELPPVVAESALTRYFVGPGRATVAWSRPTEAEAEWLRERGYTEVDADAYRVLVRPLRSSQKGRLS
jgi:hypothetical protein